MANMSNKINWFIKKSFFILPLVLYAWLAFKNMPFPGLYMDSVNPDYHAIWLMRGMNNIPAWLCPDNFLAGMYHIPLLTTPYGGNITAYLALLFFKIFGYGLNEIRIFHALLGMFLLISLMWCLQKWKISRPAVAIALCLLAVDPTFIFAWRTQYYLQLTPLIFIFLGLGILGEHYQKKESATAPRKLLFIAGIFLGFAAYVYFVFAFYAAIILISYTLINRKKQFIRNIAIPLIAGTALGWLPFVYAHVSIILNTGFHSYIEQLRGLQTAYGVIDQNQNFLERIYTIWQRLGELVIGHSLQLSIFGNWQGNTIASMVHVACLILGPALCLLHFTYPLAKTSRIENLNCIITQRTLIKLLAAIFAIHLIVGGAIGRPLHLQHYIMLLPILYALTACTINFILLNINFTRQKSLLKSMALLLIVSFFTANFSLSWEFMQRLKLTGGTGMYSDAINIAATKLQPLNADTALLFPQWGYWMGIVTILGPKFSVYEASNLETLQKAFTTDAGLLNQQKFVLVMGNTKSPDTTTQTRQQVEAFAKINHLHIANITYCLGRDHLTELWLVQLNRGV